MAKVIKKLSVDFLTSTLPAGLAGTADFIQQATGYIGVPARGGFTFVGSIIPQEPFAPLLDAGLCDGVRWYYVRSVQLAKADKNGIYYSDLRDISILRPIVVAGKPSGTIRVVGTFIIWDEMIIVPLNGVLPEPQENQLEGGWAGETSPIGRSDHDILQSAYANFQSYGALSTRRGAMLLPGIYLTRAPQEVEPFPGWLQATDWVRTNSGYCALFNLKQSTIRPKNSPIDWDQKLLYPLIDPTLTSARPEVPTLQQEQNTLLASMASSLRAVAAAAVDTASERNAVGLATSELDASTMPIVTINVQANRAIYDDQKRVSVAAAAPNSTVAPVDHWISRCPLVAYTYLYNTSEEPSTVAVKLTNRFGPSALMVTLLKVSGDTTPYINGEYFLSPWMARNLTIPGQSEQLLCLTIPGDVIDQMMNETALGEVVRELIEIIPEEPSKFAAMDLRVVSQLMGT